MHEQRVNCSERISIVSKILTLKRTGVGSILFSVHMEQLPDHESTEAKEIRRCFVMKKESEDPAGRSYARFIREQLGCDTVRSVRTGIRYDVSGVGEENYPAVQRRILGEMPVENILSEQEFALSNSGMVQMPPIESLPGLYNQTEDGAQQSIVLETGETATVRAAECIVIDGDISPDVLGALKGYVINKNENREASIIKPKTLDEPVFHPADVKVLDGFTISSDDELKAITKKYKLAMTLEDLRNVRAYFADRKHRNPTVTELKVVDTYWSDHCRHTTFTTALQNFFIDGQFVGAGDEESDVQVVLQTPMQRCVQQALREYLEDRKDVQGDGDVEKPASLMDLALLSMRRLKKQGKLDDMENSKENNAASIIVPVQFEDGHTEQWLYMFKNETHNHPTEIEPYGGAATCIGGAIRDPLSGRVYVFMGMRLSGSGDPRLPIDQTMNGKLSQRRITTGAAAGFAGYGNQIGVPTQKVVEVYHEGFVAKRLECGFVGGAAPLDQVCREDPEDGDVVILLGGRTGRDGMGGATGSSIVQNQKSTDECGAEVQKGNAPEERKIQRLFRNPKASRLIKRCNDFGAGGVSVAIGELSDGLDVDLDRVPLKYLGLDGTEIAISESQERMAVVISRKNLRKFLKLAEGENLEATEVGCVTNKEALTMTWRGKTICDLDRDFLNGGWAQRSADVDMHMPEDIGAFFTQLPDGLDHDAPLSKQWLQNLGRLNVASKRALQEHFDSTVGANTLKGPFGGLYQSSPSEAAVVKFPAPGAITAIASSIGFDPDLSAASPFHGAVYAIVDAVARIVATGGDRLKVRLTLQNYFEKLGSDATRWGKPMLAQLGAYLAQKMLGIAAIGGKDSMSGTFVDETTGTRIDVPPTLVAFAVATMESKHTIASEFQKPSHTVVHLHAPRDENGLPEWETLSSMWERVTQHAQSGAIASAHAVHCGGVAAALSEMSFGNSIGAHISHAPLSSTEWFSPQYGSMIVELEDGKDPADLFVGLPYNVLGKTAESPNIRLNSGQRTTLWSGDLLQGYESPLDSVFPRSPIAQRTGHMIESPSYMRRAPSRAQNKHFAQPRVTVLALPGTNCEYETADGFRRAGTERVDISVFVNLSRRKIQDSIRRFAHAVDRSDIVALPGGFSAGDQPGGSGKFGAALLRSPRIADAFQRLQERKGLVIGICNGFQILIKSGLLPNGIIGELQETDPTLTHNDIGHFLSRNAMHRVKSVLSPWMANFEIGETADIPIAHGEGKIIQVPSTVWSNGQVPFQYAGRDGIVRDQFPDNPNGSQDAIAALTDPTGRILGIMGHPERALPGLQKNTPTERKGQRIFDAGVSYVR